MDVTIPRSQRIVPIVEDHKNALLVRPLANFDERQMATLQHALLRGIQIVAELEEGELLGEPLPAREDRKAILLYEATEGGAGVLNRLVSDPRRTAEIARQALDLMHYDFPPEGGELKGRPDACVAGCYRCLLSYFNQPDHNLIDRRDAEVTAFLCQLAEPEVVQAEPVEASSGWLGAIGRWGLPSPSPRKVDGTLYELYWPSFQVLAVSGRVPDRLAAVCADLGVDVVELPEVPGEAAPKELIELLGAA